MDWSHTTPKSPNIDVVSASYGYNRGIGDCSGTVCDDIMNRCNNRRNAYINQAGTIGNPAQGLSKAYRVEYRCGSSGQNPFGSPEADGKELILDCNIADGENTMYLPMEIDELRLWNETRRVEDVRLRYD